MRARRTSLLGLPACLVLAGSAWCAPVPLTVSTGGVTARELAQYITGCGVTITDVRWVGASGAFAKFSDGELILGFDRGIVLSTGNAVTVAGPNAQDGAGSALGKPGDAELSSLCGDVTNDAAILEFDFIPSATTVTFDYVFGSEEYNEFVNSVYNDVFAFSLNGVNLALVPGTALPVTINNVNNGNPIGSGVISNSVYYIDNARGTATVMDPVGSATRFAGTELDGLTLVFTVTATVRPNVVNRMRFAIADVSDSVLDSAVFIRAGSFGSPCADAGSASSATAGGAASLIAAPNPYRPGTAGAFGGSGIVFHPVPAGAKVRVYTAAGELVRTMEETSGAGWLSWDARNDSGKDAASGVYIVIVEPRDGPRSRLKVVVIR